MLAKAARKGFSSSPFNVLSHFKALKDFVLP